MNNNQEILDEVLSTLNKTERWQDRLEVLANVFIQYGAELMNSDETELTPETAVMIVIDDIKKNGNTIGNSLAMQGITILEWLSRE